MIITRTPYRISVFGGSTDYPNFYSKNGSLLVGFTINQYIYVNIRRGLSLFDYKTSATYSKIERVQNNCDIENPAIRGTLQYFGNEEPLNIGVTADLPARTGIGSSSSFIVGLSRGLAELHDLVHSKRILADTAIEVERVLLKEPGGIQDQIWAAYGGVNSISIDKNGYYTVRPLPVSKEFLNVLLDRMVLFHTGFSRDSFELAASHDNEKAYDIKQRIYETAHRGYEAFTTENIDEIGQELHISWNHKRNVASGITTSIIDEVYEKALQTGAIGGKLLGAGGSGFLLFILKSGVDKADFLGRMGLTGVDFDYSYGGSEIVLNEHGNY